jgi:hypothetical protein
MSWLKSMAKRIGTSILGPMGYEIRRKAPKEAPYPVTPGNLTDDLLRLNRVAAQEQRVEVAIHPDDYIYWVCLTYKGQTWPRVMEGINYYFENGGVSAGKLANIVDAVGYPKDQQVKLLEFASGYGCVSRHLKKNPRFELTSCDIHPQAIDFLKDTIGVFAIPSVRVPEEFSPPQKYDVVFALSLFSHLPRSTFGRWLRALFMSLNVPGYLVFTTQGRKLQERLQVPDPIPDGFRFTPDSEQKDLDTAEYGTTIALPQFVIPELYRQTGGTIVSYKQADWWELQDLWVLKREK